MTGRTSDGFRGRLDAVGFVLDPSVGADLRARIELWWRDGARLLVLGGRVLLLLPEPVSVRAEHAPGLPVRAGGNGLVEVPGPGGWTALDPASLDAADLSPWLTDLGPVRRLSPVAAPPPPPPVSVAARATIPPPDLGRAAGVRRTEGTERLRRGFQEAAQSRARATWRSRGSTSGAGTPGGRGGTSWLVRTLARTPAGGMLGRRHAAYVRRLTEQFEKRDFDEALAAAIALGGLGAALSLRLPGRRTRIDRPSTSHAGGGRGMALGDTVERHLRGLYTDAATELERQGEILRAAYVLSDLLGRPVAAVELLERHGNHRLAAELAEGLALDPALGVRLWWQAGERDRAVAHARRHGVFGQAVDKLHERHPELARVLRRAWVADRQQYGDHVAAIDAAWPDRELWPAVARDLAVALTLGGAPAGHALAHALEAGTDPTVVALARAVLGGTEDAPATLDSFVRTFAARSAADPALDRELATAAAMVVAGNALGASRGEGERLLRAYRPRADPLVMADLPPLSRRRPARSSAPLVVAWRGSGHTVVADAVAVAGGEVLVALGEAGVRLLRPDGRVRARWDVPAHRLVVADHGGRVLLAADRQGVWTMHELDLPLGPPRLLPPLRAGWFVDGYDGREVLEVAPEMLRWLAPYDGGWRVTWSELVGERATALRVARGTDALAVTFDAPSGRQVWHWSMPSRRLVGRGALPLDDHVLALLPDGRRAVATPTGIEWRMVHGHVVHRTDLDDDTRAVAALGDGLVVVDAAGDTHLHPRVGEPATARLLLPGSGAWAVRRTGDLVTALADDHVAVVDVVRQEIVADVVVRLG